MVLRRGPVSPPGDKRGGFDFSYRVPGLRDWLVLYNDSLVDDDPTPLATHRGAMNPGIYLPRLPKAPKLDFRLESVYTDVLTTANLSSMLACHRASRAIATLGVYTVADPRRCGIVEVDGNSMIRSFREKPPRPASDLAFAGLLIASPAFLDAIPARVPADIGYDVLPRLAGKMAAYRVSDYLVDIGTPENYASAQREWPGLLLPGNGAEHD